MRLTSFLLFTALSLSQAVGVAAEPEPTTVPANSAIDFMKKVEVKHAATKTLNARFTQERADLFFDDIVTSEGEFWYEAPDKFHSTYKSEHSSEIWMLNGELINYVPSIKQVDVISMGTGDEAPINQMLLGFGTNVEKIQEIFEVAPAEESRKNLVGVDFTSKDLARSLDFEVVTIFFDEKSLEPKVIVARDASNDFTITLNRVRVNEKIDEKKFTPQWPDDVDVIRYDNN